MTLLPRRSMLALPGLLLARPGAAQTADWPSRAIRIIVPFPPGAGTDLLARAYAQRLTEVLGQAVVIENRAGASGMIGTEAAARAPADGYTILMANSSVLAINPAIRATLPYDPVGSFDPVALVGANDSALVVRTESPFRTVAALLAAARARPGGLSYSSAGTGTSTHMAAEFFKQTAGVDILHVPYRGSPQALTDMLGGQVDMNFNTVNAVVAAVRDGKARALATTGASRDPLLPDVPTFAEIGFTGYQASGWLGFVVPAGTPPAIVDRLAAAIAQVAALPGFAQRIASIGMKPTISTPAEFRAIIGPEIARWTRVARQAGVTVE
ncbi:Bug family tripartite tricarboxylate transporter substrate binding protein [Falsiroseomonas selenitidurans]|uniref:Tripartite tricarboxylate transporter substrate binding protein n=1 Tax=Falsiroseomonas selenitidurans TaxID=2716335 RepID=A0ABX1DZL3_9PROT|nr:tripartite tricarboxylate transporter substrate binding protein [Falsiroseomonas selenitidurans]NKC30303.1 tripartite tricarboxylate transporter substrate binding protein [Falsiroseomonas selenitidurans]